MSDDLDFDMEVVGDDDLDELGSDDASSLDDERRLVEAQSGETTAESTDPRRKRVKDNRSGSSSPESDLDDVESFPSEVDPFRFGDVPADWSVSLVGEIANGEKGLVDGDWVESKDMDEDGNIQLVQLGHIGEGQFKGQPNRFVNREFAKEEDCTILSEGDLLISRMQEPILRSCLLPDFECDSIMAVDIARLRENDDWNRICLKYLFNSRPIWKQGIAWASGTTRKRISRKNIEKIRLQKPPLPEQRKIASVLYAVDQAIQKTEEVIEQAKRVKQGLMQNLFQEGPKPEKSDSEETRFGPVLTLSPTHWDRAKIGDLYSEYQLGTAERGSTEDGRQIPLIKMGNLDFGTWDFSEVEMIDYDKELLETYRLQEGDLLFNTRNTPELVGKTAVWDSEKDAIYDNNLLRLRFDDRIDSGHYVNYYLSSGIGRRQLRARVHGTTSVAAIYQGDLEQVKIPLPPLDEQRQIVQKLRGADRLVEQNSAVHDELRRLKKSLMQDLLTGEVRTMDKAIEVLGEVKAHG